MPRCVQGGSGLRTERQRPKKPGKKVRVRVWDWPVRATHWLIVVFVFLSWLTAEKGPFEWHKYSGYAILGLVLFRIYWGFCGSWTARFTTFLVGPRAVGRYLRMLLRGEHMPAAGHNPIGGWNALSMFLLLSLQSALGLFAVDMDGIHSGGLSAFVSFDTGRTIAELHEGVFNLLLLLIGLHVAAVLVHLLCWRENLIAPMLTGMKYLPRASLPEQTEFARPWRMSIGLAGSAFLILVLIFAELRFQ